MCCVGDSAQRRVHGLIIREQLREISVDDSHTRPIDHAQPVGIRASFAEIDLAIEWIVVSGFAFHDRCETPARRHGA